jgi:hypothetical protein
MKAKDFNTVVVDVKKRMSEVLEHRAQFYADEDRFRNFKNVGRIKGTTKYDAFHGMWLKHYEALCNFMSKPTCKTPYEQWEEKIIDMINYLVLCLGMVKEDFENHKED